MEVKYIDHMGTDLSVVNAARVSFNKKSEELVEKDERLIKYLAKHGHWTPFGHTSVTLHVKAPIFIARQLQKHQVGLVWNEVSRRYVDDVPEFHVPDAWRKRPDASIKQGSGDENVAPWELYTYDEAGVDKLFYEDLVDACDQLYAKMIRKGVAPEQARMVLPQSMMTEWYWTGSIAAFARVYQQRIDAHAQKEVQEIAKQIDSEISPLFPFSWQALTRT